MQRQVPDAGSGGHAHASAIQLVERCLAGKRTDLILLKQNPLKDVANTRKISGVMAAGRWYDQKTLAALITP